MPFNELQRRDSWPPTIVRIHEDDIDDIDDFNAIDENPFSFFLTTPEELDIEDNLEDLSAGIESDDDAEAQVRSVSPSAIQRRRLDHGDESSGLAAPLISLKDFTRAHTSSGRKSRASQRPEDALTGLGIMMPEFDARRGRAKVRLMPSRSGRGRGQTRSLSLRRPHSWREPSPEVWPIAEERESDDEEEGKAESATTTGKEEPQAPHSPEIVEKKAAPSPKPIKHVHWAF